MLPCLPSFPSTFVHRSLWCDGHEHCPLGADEGKAAGCDACPGRTYPSEYNYGCPHWHTGNPICSVPCNGRDNFCRVRAARISSIRSFFTPKLQL